MKAKMISKKPKNYKEFNLIDSACDYYDEIHKDNEFLAALRKHIFISFVKSIDKKEEKDV